MGYLLIDHSAGAGPTGERGIKQEYDTKTCPHCNGVVKIYVKRHLIGEQDPPTDEGAFCLKCMAPICLYCAQSGECVPFMRKLRERLRRQETERRLLAALSLERIGT